MADTEKHWQVVKTGAFNDKVRLVGTKWNDLAPKEQQEAAAEFRSHGTDGERGLFFTQLYAKPASAV